MQYPITHRGDGAFLYPLLLADEIESAIRCILTTLPGEHPRLPDFGNHAALTVFRNPGGGLETVIAGLVKWDIETWEPRARVEDVSVAYNDEEAAYRVKILWSTPDSGIRDMREVLATIGGL